MTVIRLLYYKAKVTKYNRKSATSYKLVYWKFHLNKTKWENAKVEFIRQVPFLFIMYHVPFSINIELRVALMKRWIFVFTCFKISTPDGRRKRWAPSYGHNRVYICYFALVIQKRRAKNRVALATVDSKSTSYWEWPYTAMLKLYNTLSFCPLIFTDTHK